MRINSSQRLDGSSTARLSGKARTTSTSGTPNWLARSMVIWFGFSRIGRLDSFFRVHAAILANAVHCEPFQPSPVYEGIKLTGEEDNGGNHARQDAEGQEPAGGSAGQGPGRHPGVQQRPGRQADQVDVPALMQTREELVEALISLKTAINEANREAQRDIYDLAEKKAHGAVPGRRQHPARPAAGCLPEHHRGHLRRRLEEGRRGRPDAGLEKDIDQLQDKLDQFNHDRKVEVDGRTLELPARATRLARGQGDEGNMQRHSEKVTNLPDPELPRRKVHWFKRQTTSARLISSRFALLPASRAIHANAPGVIVRGAFICAAPRLRDADLCNFLHKLCRRRRPGSRPPCPKRPLMPHRRQSFFPSTVTPSLSTRSRTPRMLDPLPSS